MPAVRCRSWHRNCGASASCSWSASLRNFRGGRLASRRGLPEPAFARPILRRGRDERSGRLESFSIVGWSVELGEADLEPQYLPGQGRALARLSLSLVAERYPQFHVWKVLVPLTMIVFMAWAVFSVDPQQLSPQMGVSTASVLTLIAFQFSLGYLAEGGLLDSRRPLRSRRLGAGLPGSRRGASLEPVGRRRPSRLGALHRSTLALDVPDPVPGYGVAHLAILRRA